MHRFSVMVISTPIQFARRRIAQNVCMSNETPTNVRIAVFVINRPRLLDEHGQVDLIGPPLMWRLDG